MFAHHSLWPERAGSRRSPLTVLIASSAVGFCFAVTAYFAFTALNLSSDPPSIQKSNAGLGYEQSPYSDALVGVEPSLDAGLAPSEAEPTTPERAPRGAPRANRPARMMLPIIGAQRQFLREETDGSSGGPSDSVAALAAAPKQEKPEATPQPAATTSAATEAAPPSATERPPKTLKRYAKSIKRVAKPTRIVRTKIERRRTYLARLHRRELLMRHAVWPQQVYSYSGWGW